MIQIKWLIYLAFLLLSFACSKQNPEGQLRTTRDVNELYSHSGREYKAQFQAAYRTTYTKIEDVNSFTLNRLIRQTTKFLFGPLTYRSLGGIQKGEKIFPQIEKATIQNGFVVVPYTYEGVWMIHSEKVPSPELSLPLPFAAADIAKTNWLSCTDASDEDHATLDFLWYFWDPSREGCENQENVDYQTIQIHFSQENQQTTNTFPEYDRMVHMVNGRPLLAMTFAFGYVQDVAHPDPFKDYDQGMDQFRQFYNLVRAKLVPMGFSEMPILQSEVTTGSNKIGARFSGRLNGVESQISVISNAGVDQMDLFASSFGARHEGFFGWFGHSRVGDGFDADNFDYMLRLNPKKYSMSKEYQLVYWAGCNSYSYYTTPFFALKVKLDPENDANGTKQLDIISNTLPSLFAFNAANANVLFQALINKNKKISYQKIVDQIEISAQRSGYDVIVNVLGDEDNN